MKTCQEFITAISRCGKPAVITELEAGFKKDLCAECAKRIYLSNRLKKNTEGKLK